jgi:hypothetical protein
VIEKESFRVVLFKSVNHALMAEKVLKTEGIPFKLIPVPKQISSECGICLRFASNSEEQILQALSGKVEISEIRPLK